MLVIKVLKSYILTLFKSKCQGDVVFHWKYFPFHVQNKAYNSQITHFFLPVMTSRTQFDFSVIPDVFHFISDSNRPDLSETFTSSHISNNEVYDNIPTVIRRSTRIIKAPVQLNEYVRHFSQLDFPETAHWCNLVSFNHLSSTSHSFIASNVSLTEPHTYEEASTDPRWITAMNSEIKALQTNDTWVMAPLHAGKKPIGCKWVYKIKLKADWDCRKV